MAKIKKLLRTKKTFKWYSLAMVGLILFLSAGCAVAMYEKPHTQVPTDEQNIKLKKYFLNQKLWTLGDQFIIRDEKGDPHFFVRGKVFSLGDKLKFYAMDGYELAYIKQKLFSFRKQYRIYHDHQELARIIKKITLFKDKFIVDVPGPDDYSVKGDFTNHHYTFRRNGKIVAFVSKKWFTWSDNYLVEIIPGEYDILILATAVVIDMIKDKEQVHHFHHNG